MRLRALGLVVICLCSLGSALASTDASAFREYTIQDLMVAMTDGVHLHARVALPASGAGPWPVLLYRTPYNVESTNVDWVADAGYVGVSQDTRGRFASEGVDRMWRDEGYGPDNRDGAETIEWILQQPWCNGRIATYGASASAINENLLAAALPESVRCMITYMAAADLYGDLFFPGGAFRQIDMETWLRAQGAESNIDSVYVHPDHDAWWSWLDTTPRHPLETIPTYQIGGWFDIFPNGPIHSFTGLQDGGAPGAAGNQKLIMGPWIHGLESEQQGELTFPGAASENAQALIGMYWEWLDHWIFGAANGIMSKPPIAYYLMGDATDPDAPGNEWRTSWTWPPPSSPVDLYLHEAGVLSLAAPAKSEAPQSYAYDPLHPVPTLGGGNLVIPAGPYDQRTVLDRPDVLVYSTPPLGGVWEVTGAVAVELYVASDRLDTDFTAKLCDVYPDGRVMLVTDGILRARHRLRMDGEDLLTPNQVVMVRIELPQTAIAFNKGHRILLAISSSNAPRFDPNPNTGEPFMRHTTTLVARNTIYHERTYPSRLTLPVSGELPATVALDPVDADRADVDRADARLSVGPNPFASRSAFRWRLDAPGRVDLRIVDIGGRHVRTLADGVYPSGDHASFWDGDDQDGHDVPAGAYRYIFHAGSAERSGTIIRVK